MPENSRPGWLLFVFGIALIMGAGIWYFREGDPYEAALAFMSGIAAIIEDHFGVAHRWRSRRELKRLGKDRLRELGNELGLRNLDRLTTRELIASINERQTVIEKQERAWHWRKRIIFGSAVAAIPLVVFTLNRVRPLPSMTPPLVDLQWYQNMGDEPELVDLDKVRASIEAEDVARNRIRLPIQLALRNRDGRPLKVTRVEVTYPKGIRVTSSGEQKLSPEKGIHIYVHDLGVVEPGDSYTFLSSPKNESDIISIPYHFFTSTHIVKTSDNIPIYITTIVGQGVFAETVVELGVRVLCDERPPIVRRILLGLKAGFHAIMEGDKAINNPVAPMDNSLFGGDYSGSEVVAEWNAEIGDEGNTEAIEYRSIRTDAGHLQLITLDKLLRQMSVDSNNDGFLDTVLMDTNGDGQPDLKFIWEIDWPMSEWKKEWARVVPKK